ncbi:collagen alpha-1(XII) chain [Elysia marginata]|uniref:Collagen alpha-1(XII) chain n=1 Tax=Elysia marginata TaxID=1093978 RepID=A0AAV4IZ82_9GAST|nr:collagen alpha-1(XII) chain [Elysia marginata]
MGANTDTHKALETALRNSFRSEKGGRYGAVKIVMVITDGRSNMPTETENMANEVRKMGAMIISIGIGNDVDPDELRKISANSSNVFRAENFDVLDTIAETVERRTCDITIDLGGGVNGTRTGGGSGQFDMRDYMRWCMEQELMRKERESARKMLEALENSQKEEKERVQKREHDRAEHMHMEEIKEHFHEVVEMQNHMDKLSYHLMEMKHSFYFMVTSEMIKLCSLGERREEVRMLLMHGDSHWEPGNEENCDMEDMERVDENVTPLEVAQQLAGKSEMVKLEAFFGGLKVCGDVSMSSDINDDVDDDDDDDEEEEEEEDGDVMMMVMMMMMMIMMIMIMVVVMMTTTT